MSRILHKGDATSPDLHSLPQLYILLALYNGAVHLEAQLHSYSVQTYRNWGLIASDDGSKDETLALLQQFQRHQPQHLIHVQQGPGQGFVRNFFALLQAVPPHATYAALSDQDDVWHPDKLARAVQTLAALPPGTPGLYCAATLICDEDLRALAISKSFARAPDFRNALVQSIGGGNTMVLNRAAVDLVQQAIPEARNAVAHDWWLYQIITACGGVVVRDDTPVLQYRQHGGNLIGANISFRARALRAKTVLKRRFQNWNQINIDALMRSRDRFTPESQRVLLHYAAACHGGLRLRLQHLYAAGVYRQSPLGTLALYILCALRRM